MPTITIIGCGVVGAAIAYELSLIPNLNILVLDKQIPAQGATAAALGVLMGVISKKVKGKAWHLRQRSIERYETLIPELETRTGLTIPYNRQGIVLLQFDGEDVSEWEKLAATRATQGYRLEIWDKTQLQTHCPQIQNDSIIGAVYSPQDRQLNPTALTQALVAGAKLNGVTFKFGVEIERINADPLQLHTNIGQFDSDWLVISAGLGSTPLTAVLKQPVAIKPVLGQAIHFRTEQSLGSSNFQPAITGDDVHIVPVSGNEYWVGATVEFPNVEGEVSADTGNLIEVKEKAIAFCPQLSQATILKTWSGLRPRPEGRPAPIIDRLPGYNNILLATGHYRNGVLLAPATAQIIREMILNLESGIQE